MDKLKTSGIKQEKLLYAILRTTKEEFEEVIRLKKFYYSSFFQTKKDKRGRIIYKNGVPKKRTINTTSERLREYQDIVAKKILAKITLPSNVKGSVKGGSNIANAAAHLGKHYKFKTDIKNYFPSISHERVHSMFLKNGFSRKVASLLTHITTFNYELPQGTPTSSAIANLVFVPNDHKIVQFCRQHKITHTRYVDDLVFSSAKDFKDKLIEIIQFILDDGFKISVNKTIYTAGTMEITGIITKQNILVLSKEYEELVTDPTIDLESNKGRKMYMEAVKQFNKNKKG